MRDPLSLVRKGRDEDVVFRRGLFDFFPFLCRERPRLLPTVREPARPGRRQAIPEVDMRLSTQPEISSEGELEVSEGFETLP